MIPREILKKIRPIELGTNRLVTETIDIASWEPRWMHGGAPPAVPAPTTSLCPCAS